MRIRTSSPMLSLIASIVAIFIIALEVSGLALFIFLIFRMTGLFTDSIKLFLIIWGTLTFLFSCFDNKNNKFYLEVKDTNDNS